jgi:Carboxypeptidase regulatory-like domain
MRRPLASSHAREYSLPTGRAGFESRMKGVNMRSLQIFAGVLAIAICGWGQSDRGTITGTVSDPAGAVVANAGIQAKHIETGVTYEAASSGTGNFTIVQLPVGTYELTVSVQGFKKYIRTGLQVGVAQTLRVDVPLEVGATSEAVTVTEAAPLLKTESGELSHTVNLGQLTELPLFVVTAGIRNPYRIMDLIPGTYSAGDIRVNGVPANSAAYRVEGQDATNGTLPSFPTQNQASVDAIQEVAVQTSNFAAEYGQVGGGVLNVTMRSGTNQFHGSVYEYYVNEFLNAGQPYTNDGTGHNIRPRTRRNDYGYTVGGPVWIPKIYDGRNRSFFFISWEQYKVTLNNTNDPKTVPTPAYRLGDFSAAILPNARPIGADPIGRQMLQGMIYDPSSVHTDPATGRVYRDQFVGNKIDPTRFDSISVKLQSMFPAPVGANAGALINNYINPYSSTNKQHIPSIKADQAIGDKAKITFFWQKTYQDTIGGTGLQQGDGLPGYLTTSLASFVTAPLYRLNFDYTLTPTVLLHFGGGYHSTYFGTPSLTADGKVVYTDAPYNAEKELGLKGGVLHKLLPRFASLSDPLLGGMKDFGETSSGVPNASQSPTFVAAATWVKSNHTYKFGSELRTDGYQALQVGSDGTYSFAADQTGQPFQQAPVGGVNVGLPYASFLLGLVKSVSMTGPVDPRLGKKQLGIYAQDTWKVTRRFTLDYGLRYDYATYLQESQGRAPSFSHAAIHPLAGLPGASIYDGDGPGRCGCNFAHNYPYAFAPRLGAAYQINSKTVLRLGFGIVYAGTEQGNQSSILVANSAGSGTAPFASSLSQLSAGYPAQYNPRAWPTYDPAFFPTSFPVPGAAPTNYDRNSGRPGRQYQWSIGVQREIFKDLAVEVSYVGNRGIWWQAPGLLNYNAVTYDRLKSFGLDVVNSAADRQLLTSTLSSAVAAQRGFKAPYPGFPTAGVTVFQALRPFPQFTNIPVAYNPMGKTWYDSLQVKANQRLSHGLSFGMTFTWQKNLSQGAAEREPNFGTTASGQINDAFNLPVNKYISQYSQPLVFLTNVSYITPKTPGNKIVSWLARDWTLGAFLAYRSGLPYVAPSAQTSLSSYLGQTTFANRVPGQPLFTVDLDCHCYDPRNVFVLNPKAWADPPPGTFGTAAAYYTDYRAQRRPQENFNFGRTFRITERVSFNIRAEFSDIFNRAFIGDVGSGGGGIGPGPAIGNLTNATTSVQTRNPNGTTASGFGALLNLGPINPRQGNLIGRITF